MPKNILTPLEDRFWAKVVKTENCWKWHGSTHSFGYGQISEGKRTGKPTVAHRVSWQIHFGEIPKGKYVLHHCDNPPCTNPAHLFLGTFDDNMRDRSEKKRTAYGEKSGTSKLTEKQVKEIREEYLLGKTTHKKIGFKHGVARTTVSGICRRETWKHLS